MSKFIFIFLSVLLVFVQINTQEAWAQVRTYSNEFLTLGVGARGLGMGNAQVASVSDVTAAYWNPAGLNDVSNLQAAAMHAEWFAGIAKYDYLGVALPISDGKRVLGISAIRFGVDDIPNTLDLIQPDGSINYDNISRFSAADYGFLLSYAQTIGDKLYVGANAKIIYRQVGSFANAWGFGLDLGAQYKISERFTLGATLKDATTTVNAWSFNFTDEEKQLLTLADNVIPSRSTELTGPRLILGAAYDLKITDKFSLLTSADIDFTFDGQRNVLIGSSAVSIDPHIGLELNYGDFLFLRAGIHNIQKFTDDIDGSTFTSIQPNAGLGIKIRKEIQIDYAFNGLNRVSDGVYSHVFSLIVNFKKKN